MTTKKKCKYCGAFNHHRAVPLSVSPTGICPGFGEAIRKGNQPKKPQVIETGWAQVSEPKSDLKPKDLKEPTIEQLVSPEFEAVWQVIKGWDIQRTEGEGYAHATGTDVATILNTLQELFRNSFPFYQPLDGYDIRACEYCAGLFINEAPYLVVARAIVCGASVTPGDDLQHEALLSRRVDAKGASKGEQGMKKIEPLDRGRFYLSFQNEADMTLELMGKLNELTEGYNELVKRLEEK